MYVGIPACKQTFQSQSATTFLGYPQIFIALSTGRDMPSMPRETRRPVFAAVQQL